MTGIKRTKADGQLTGLSGEFFVAAELLRRGLQCSVTFGNAKAIDPLVYHPASEKTASVQVKALRRKTYFPLSAQKVKGDCVYVFVILNRPGELVEYFIVPGRDLLTGGTARFGKHWEHPTRPSIAPKYLEGYKDNWEVIEMHLRT